MLSKKMKFSALTVISAAMLFGCNNEEDVATTHSEEKATVQFGYATSIMSYPMTLLPEYTEEVDVALTSFTSGNDVMTALVSESLDVAQITYLHYIRAMESGFDIVAISGQVNGGTEVLIKNDLNIAVDDWDVLKNVVEEFKGSGQLFRIATSRGSAQDIQIRAELQKHGIDPMKDVEIINISNATDHVVALERGEVEMAATVEPVGTMAIEKGSAKHFTFPYNQAAGKLTNLIVTRSDVIEEKPEVVEAVIGGVVDVISTIDQDPKLWVDVVNEYTPLDAATGEKVLNNAYPDYKVYRESAISIVEMMSELNYIKTDVTALVEENIDYQFLEKVTGKPKEELGYNE